ncbi:MAG: hypothetical protein WD381_00060 [Balneolaceae bacterium]
MLKFLSVAIFYFLLVGCQGGQVATQNDSPDEGMTTAPANETVQIVPSISDSEIEQFAIAVVHAEEDGVEAESIESMEPYIEEVELSRDRYIQIQRGIQLDAEIENSVQGKIREIRNERNE